MAGRRRSRSLVADALQQDVGVGLEPDRLGAALGSGTSVMRCNASGRRRLAWSASSERLVAIRWSQVGQLAERVFVATTRTGEGLLGHVHILALAVPFIRLTSNGVEAARNSPLSFRRDRRLNKRNPQQSNEGSCDGEDRCQ
jgi:hypothetical protein